MRQGLGQLGPLLSFASQTQNLVASTYLADRQIRKDYDLAKSRMQHESNLHKMTAEQARDAILAKQTIARRKEELAKDIAIYAGVGVVTLTILITLGVLFVSRKSS